MRSTAVAASDRQLPAGASQVVGIVAAIHLRRVRRTVGRLVEVAADLVDPVDDGRDVLVVGRSIAVSEAVLDGVNRLPEAQVERGQPRIHPVAHGEVDRQRRPARGIRLAPVVESVERLSPRAGGSTRGTRAAPRAIPRARAHRRRGDNGFVAPPDRHAPARADYRSLPSFPSRSGSRTPSIRLAPPRSTMSTGSLERDVADQRALVVVHVERSGGRELGAHDAQCGRRHLLVTAAGDHGVDAERPRGRRDEQDQRATTAPINGEPVARGVATVLLWCPPKPLPSRRTPTGIGDRRR